MSAKWLLKAIIASSNSKLSVSSGSHNFTSASNLSEVFSAVDDQVYSALIKMKVRLQVMSRHHSLIFWMRSIHTHFPPLHIHPLPPELSNRDMPNTHSRNNLTERGGVSSFQSAHLKQSGNKLLS